MEFKNRLQQKEISVSLIYFHIHFLFNTYMLVTRQDKSHVNNVIKKCLPASLFVFFPFIMIYIHERRKCID